MSSNLKTLLYIAAIFLAGAATGAVVGACAAKRLMFLHPLRPHEVAERMRHQLQTRLKLTPEQQQKIDPILNRTDSELKSIHQDAMARVAKAIDQAQSQIAAELSPEQKEKLAAMAKERREFLRRRAGAGPGGGFQHRTEERPAQSPATPPPADAPVTGSNRNPVPG